MTFMNWFKENHPKLFEWAIKEYETSDKNMLEILGIEEEYTAWDSLIEHIDENIDHLTYVHLL